MSSLFLHSGVSLIPTYFITKKCVKLIKNIQTSEENLSNLQIFNDVEISFWYTQEDEIHIEIFLTERWYLWPYPILYFAQWFVLRLGVLLSEPDLLPG